MTHKFAPPAEPAASRQRFLRRWALVWLLGCLLVVGYGWLFVVRNDGTPNWLDVVVFGGWVFVAGAWLIVVPPLRWSRRARQVAWGVGAAILIVTLALMAVPWVFTPFEEIAGLDLLAERPGVVIPAALNRWLLEVNRAYDNQTASTSLILKSGLIVAVTSLALTFFALLWCVVYKELKPYGRRWWPWVGHQRRRLENVPFWVAAKRIVQIVVLALLLAIALGLLLTAWPTRPATAEIIRTDGLWPGVPPSVSSLAIGPDGHSLFAFTTGEVYRSTDRGESWQPTTEPGVAVGASVVAQDNSHILIRTGDGYALWDETTASWRPAAGLENVSSLTALVSVSDVGLFLLDVSDIYRSRDGGLTWEVDVLGIGQEDPVSFITRLVSSPDGRGVLAVSFDALYRLEPGAEWQTIYAPSGNMELVQLTPVSKTVLRLFAASSGGLAYSDDLGQTWQDIEGLQSALGLLYLRPGLDELNLITREEAGVYISNDGGKTWQSASPELTNSNVSGVFALPASQTLFATMNDGGLFRSADAGSSWERVLGLMGRYIVQDVVETPQGDYLFAATDRGGIFRSGDRGATWEPVNRGLGAATILTLATGLNEKTVFAAASQVLLRSEDGGMTWQPSIQGMGPRYISTLVVGPDGQSLFAAGSQGIFRSLDNGLNWTQIGRPLEEYFVYALIVEPDTRTIFAGTTGPRIFRSEDSGATWERKDRGLDGIYVAAFTPGPDGRSLITATDSSVYRSVDNGTSWESFSSGLDRQIIRTLATHPTDGRLFAGTVDGLYIYDEQARSWRLASAGSLSNVWALAFEPQGQKRLLAGGGHGLVIRHQADSFGSLLSDDFLVFALLSQAVDGSVWIGTDRGLLRTRDSGATWEAMNTLTEMITVHSLAAADDHSLFVATPMGVFRSLDGGATWQMASRGLDSLVVEALIPEAFSGSVVGRTTTGGILIWDRAQVGWRPLEPEESAVAFSALTVRQRDPVRISRPGLRYPLPWVDSLPPIYALAVDEPQRTATVYDLDPLGDLTRQQIPLPLIWNWPTPYLNLIGATWVGLYWVQDNWTALLLVISLIALVAGTYIYAAIVRPNRLSPRLTLWLLPRSRHLFAAGGYRGYRARWDAQRPLERFIWLFARQRDPFTPAAAVPELHAGGVACDETEVELALSALAHQGALREEAGRWTLVEPLLADIMARDLPADITTKLADTIRRSNPLYVETQYFFQDAPFDLQRQGDFGFRASSDLPGWRGRSPFYVHVVLERALDLDVVREIRQASGGLSGRPADRSMALAAIDRAPRAGDLYQIFATRAQTGLTIVPLPLTLMRQARIERSVLETLNTQVNLYTGQEDMYDVKTAVSDVLSFFGRQSQLADLQTRLTAGRSVMVYGVRKIGKSSLLHRLREETGWPTAIIRAEGYATGLSYIMQEALREWRAIITTEHPHLPLPDGDLDHYDELGAKVQAFRLAVRGLLAQLAQLPGKPGLLLFLDEMEYLYYQDPKTFTDIARVLRDIAEAPQSHGRFALLVAGLLPDLNRTDHLAGTRNPFYTFFEEAPLGPLALDDARTMVISLGGQMAVSYSDEALDCLVQTGGGHPLLTRQLCHFAIDRRMERPLTIDLAAARQGIQNYLWQPDNYLARSLWPDSRGAEGGAPDPDEAAILMALAANGSRTEEELRPAALPPPARARRQQALARLKNLSVVRQDGQGRWSIAVPLYEEWIRRTMLSEHDGAYDAEPV